MSRLHRPRTLKELTRIYAELPDALVLAGGATVMKRLHKQAPPQDVIDLSQLSELRGIQVGRYGSWLGALSTLKELAEDPLIRKHHPSLAQACSYGPPQVRGRASIGGALTARHFANTPVLLCLGAYVELLHHVSGKRRARVLDFVREGPAPGEVLVALHLPPPAEGEHTLFRRVSSGGGDIVIAARVLVAGDEVQQACVVVGASDLPSAHLSLVEEALVARNLSSQAAAQVPQALSGANDYQRAVCTRVLRSWLEHLVLA